MSTKLIWRHVKTGNLYRITGVGLRESDLTLEFEYNAVDGGPTFHRPVAEFLDGRFIPVVMPNAKDD